jgi:hypothetical protein
MNHEYRSVSSDWIGWQGEYRVVSFGERSLGEVVEYVTHQRERHAQDRLLSIFERLERERNDHR